MPDERRERSNYHKNNRASSVNRPVIIYPRYQNSPFLISGKGYASSNLRCLQAVTSTLLSTPLAGST